MTLKLLIGYEGTTGGRKALAYITPLAADPTVEVTLLTVARNAEVTVRIGERDLPFYTAGSMAAARDGAAVVRAMRNGRELLLRGPGANGRGTTSDTFPLAGFSAAYDAISKECPAGARG